MADGSAAENAWDMDGGGPCRVRSFHHILFHVSNALQASFWYCFHFGFERFAQRQSNQYSEVAIRNGSIIFLFKSPISPEDPQKVGDEIAIHGDFVKDVAYSVDNLDFVLEHLTRCGHRLLEAKKEVRDADGSLLIARIAGSAGSIVHTLVQNIDYRGHFMPLFKPARNFTFCQSLMPISFCQIDHVVEAHPEHTLDNVSVWYKRMLRFHRFWSIDDKLVHTKFSALNAVLMGNDETLQPNVKITLVEPVQVNGRKRRGQVQEFLDFHGTSGVQHIAFQTDDIVAVVEKLRGRGVEFLPIPHSYYDLLKSRLSEREKDTNCKQPQPIEEDLSKIRELGILMDFDERGYLLQIFTKPVQDRATLFLEIIQRHNFNGFGAGNFKALFEAVEMEQRRREEEETTD